MVDGYPGLYRDVQTYLKERIREVLTGSSDAIVVRIYGPELEILRSKAEEVEQALVGHRRDRSTCTSSCRRTSRRSRSRSTWPRRSATASSRATCAGRPPPWWPASRSATSTRPAQLYDVTVWSVPEARDSLTSIRELLIDTPGGGHVRLEDVADVRIMPTPNVIKRENVSRRIDVSAQRERPRPRLGGGATSSAASRRSQFPLEYHRRAGGRVRRAAGRPEPPAGATRWPPRSASSSSCRRAFGSWRLATLAFLTLPSALVGGVLAAFLGGGVISLGSLVGFLTVLGIAARNGILLINHYQHLEREEGEPFGPGLVLRGARERLPPILMTALTTGLALLPLVVLGEIPGHEIEHPMAVVILGGLVTSTLLNLFIVPVLYLRFGASDMTGSRSNLTAEAYGSVG